MWDSVRDFRMMEWHWFYSIGIVWAIVNIVAIFQGSKNIDPEIEKLWQDNF